MDTKQIGNITELQVLTYITQLGYQVSIPFGDRERYDQSWDIHGKLIRVQVKTASSKSSDDDSIKFSCRSSYRHKGKSKNTRYTNKEIDYFATFWENKCYVVPVTETSAEKTLRFKSTKNNQLNGISFAEDYEAEKILSKR